MSKNVLVIGDLMLDRFIYGTVSRISPEAPIPVLKYDHETMMPGGAGNVALNLVAQECRTALIGRVGDDADGDKVVSLLKHAAVRAAIFREKDLVTVRKTRYISGTSHLLREDRESVVDFTLTKEARGLIEKEVCKADVVLLSDYGKGFLTPEVCQCVIKACRLLRKPVVVDPKGDDYGKYRGAFLVKPNLKEFSEATKTSVSLSSPGLLRRIKKGAESLVARYRYGGVLVTLGEAGMALVSKEVSGGMISVATEAREVFDVSGAGDTALAALAMALAEGRSVAEAMKVANTASGIAVSKLGTAIVSRSEIAGAGHAGRVMSIEEARDFVALSRQSGKTVGFTNGCFDCCHLGHLSSIAQAKSFCDVLIVGVNTDKWIRAHKGVGRPVHDEVTRATLLSSLKDVSAVVLFGDETALPLVKALKPDVIAKEGYALKDWPEGRWVNAHGGRAITLARLDGCSTTGLVKKMHEAHL